MPVESPEFHFGLLKYGDYTPAPFDWADLLAGPSQQMCKSQFADKQINQPPSGTPSDPAPWSTSSPPAGGWERAPAAVREQATEVPTASAGRDPGRGSVTLWRSRAQIPFSGETGLPGNSRIFPTRRHRSAPWSPALVAAADAAPGGEPRRNWNAYGFPTGATGATPYGGWLESETVRLMVSTSRTPSGGRSPGERSFRAAIGFPR